MGKYIRKKVIIYLLTFIIAVTVNWAIPRFMPGDPISILAARFGNLGEARQNVMDYFNSSFGFNKPLHEQYFNFWGDFLKGNLGVSIFLYPKPVIQVIGNALWYDLLLLLPAILLAWIVGNKLGALSAVNKKVDNFLMPVFYTLTSAPYFWFAVVLAWIFGISLGWFPISGAYSANKLPSFTWDFISDYFMHWILPFLSLFIVALGGWAIGMRNMIIYEMGSNYSRYMESLGSSPKLIRKYAFRNGVLPQITGLAIQLGTIVAGALTTEMVFAYPGIGYTLLQAILNQDFFLIQGCFIFIVTGVLIANFAVDIIYIFVDPRIRHSYSGEV